MLREILETIEASRLNERFPDDALPACLPLLFPRLKPIYAIFPTFLFFFYVSYPLVFFSLTYLPLSFLHTMSSFINDYDGFKTSILCILL